MKVSNRKKNDRQRFMHLGRGKCLACGVEGQSHYQVGRKGCAGHYACQVVSLQTLAGGVA